MTAWGASEPVVNSAGSGSGEAAENMGRVIEQAAEKHDSTKTAASLMFGRVQMPTNLLYLWWMFCLDTSALNTHCIPDRP